MAILLKGDQVAERIRQNVRHQSETLERHQVAPTLALVRAGERKADIAYERNILRQAAEFHVQVRSFLLPEEVRGCEAAGLLREISADPGIHGCLVFRPLPGHLDLEKLADALGPWKDVDAMATSIGYLSSRREKYFAPCTAVACMKLLDYYRIPLEGKKAVVIGKGPAVGLPAALLLLNAGATVSVCHILTPEQEIRRFCQNADLIVAAAGSPGVVRGDMVRPGQTVIDIGISPGPDGELHGDVAYDEVAKIVEAITPVPGGVGAVTTAVLMEHTVKAACRTARSGEPLNDLCGANAPQASKGSFASFEVR